METLTPEQLKTILEDHRLWFRGQGGKRAVLSGADLSDADLSGADLRGAYLRGAYLRGADLRGVYWDRNIPVIEDIHQKVHKAASKEGALDMTDWHSECGTTHCRAGWVVTLAGERGKELEKETGTAYAALAIYAASDPDYFTRDGIPDFFASNEDALADMKRLSELEASQ